LNEIAGGLERVRALKSELTGSLRLTAPVSWGQRVLARHLSSFLKLHPAVEIELMLSDRIMDLAAERIDIAFRWSATATGELKNTPIISVPWLLTAAPEYLTAHDMPLTPSELSSHNCLYYRRDSSDDNWVLTSHHVQPEAVQEKIPVRVSTRYAVDNAEAVLDAAVAGLGIALLPDYLSEKALREGSLVRVLPEWTPLTKFGSHIVALITPERMNFSRNNILLDYLLTAIGKEVAA
jgi:DNA-binding transcriptional LysR family regulator